MLYRELSSSPNDLHGRVMDKCCAAAEAGCSSRSSFNDDISPSSSTGNDASCIMDILCNANANMPYKLGSELDSISSNIAPSTSNNNRNGYEDDTGSLSSSVLSDDSHSYFSSSEESEDEQEDDNEIGRASCRERVC